MVSCARHDHEPQIVAANEGVFRFAGLAAVLLSVFFYLNLLLFAFNLVPLPPLDGSSVVMLFLSDDAAEKYAAFTKSPGMSMVGLILAWQLFGAVAPVLHHWAINLLYPTLHYS